MRLFTGIALSEPSAAELTRLCARLGPRGDGLRWLAPESWHITLQFLGNAAPERLERLKSHLARVHCAPVSIRSSGLDVFDRFGVLLAGIELTPGLAMLQQRIAEATGRCGFEREDRPFRPHITLARSKNGHGRQQLKLLRTQTPEKPLFSRFAASEFLLYESQFGPGGSKYGVLHRFPLSGEMEEWAAL